MKDLRGQISVFVIIGLLILISMGLIIFSFQQINISQPPAEVEEAPVRAYIQGCLDETTKEALFTLGLHGGYTAVPEPKTNALLILSIPYFLYDKKTYVPPLDEIANQMEQYLSNPLKSCLLGISDISGFNGSYSIEKISVTFQDQSVSTDLIMPVTMVSSGSKTTVEEFHAEVPTSFPELYALSKDIVDKASQKGGYFPISYSTMITAEKGYNLEYTSTDDAMIVSLIDPNSVYGEQQLFFTFALSNPASSAAKAVEIENIVPQSALIYYPFSLTIHARGEDVRFNDTTDIFNIDKKTGVIAFTPAPQDAGNYTILITAENEYGSDVQILHLEITSLNQAPQIENIPLLFGKVGIPLYYQVIAVDVENDSLHFLSSDAKLPIDSTTGIINATFTAPYNGNFTVSAIDAYGNAQSQDVYVSVKK